MIHQSIRGQRIACGLDIKSLSLLQHTPICRDVTCPACRKFVDDLIDHTFSPINKAPLPLEPPGGNLYRPHALMISSGEFWRCKHGSTGFVEEMHWVGCVECKKEDPEAFKQFSREVEHG